MSLTGSDSGGTKKELTESYYLDTSHPLTSRKLDEFLEEACLKNDDRYMTWVNPYEKMSHKEFYTKVISFLPILPPCRVIFLWHIISHSVLCVLIYSYWLCVI